MRVKGGVVTRRRHKRLLKLSEGYRGRRRNCFQLAERAVEKGLQHAYRDRRAKKREYRALWIARINAGARLSGISYSRLIAGLNAANIQLDRKALAELSINDPKAFASIADQAKRALA